MEITPLSPITQGSIAAQLFLGATAGALPSVVLVAVAIDGGPLGAKTSLRVHTTHDCVNVTGFKALNLTLPHFAHCTRMLNTKGGLVL